MIFNYDANITHFHNKGFALSLVLKVRVFGTRKCPIHAPYCQENIVVFGENAGQQCFAMSLCTLIYSKIRKITSVEQLELTYT